MDPGSLPESPGSDPRRGGAKGVAKYEAHQPDSGWKVRPLSGGPYFWVHNELSDLVEGVNAEE